MPHFFRGSYASILYVGIIICSTFFAQTAKSSNGSIDIARDMSASNKYYSVSKRKALQKFIDLQVSKASAPEVVRLIPNYDMDLAFCLRTNKEALFSVSLPLVFRFHFPGETNSLGLVDWENAFRVADDMHISGTTFTWHLGRLRHIASCIKTTATQIQFWYSQLIRYKNAPKVDALTNYGIKLQFIGRANTKLTLYQDNSSPFRLGSLFTIESGGIRTEYNSSNPSLILNKDLFQINNLSVEQRRLLTLFI